MHLINLARNWKNPKVSLYCIPAVGLSDFFFLFLYSLWPLFCNRVCLLHRTQHIHAFFIRQVLGSLKFISAVPLGSVIIMACTVPDGDSSTTLFCLLEKVQQTVRHGVSSPRKEEESLDRFSYEPFLYCLYT